jgi:hypothetical protein
VTRACARASRTRRRPRSLPRLTLPGLLAAIASALGPLLPACAPGQGARAAPPTAREADVASDRAIRAELLDYYDDLSAREWEAFADHFWPGATITTVWQPPGADAVAVDVGTVERFVELAPQGPGSREIFEERMTRCLVRVHGGLAQAWAHYDASFGDPGEVTEWSGIDAFTLLRHEGRWRIVSIAFTDMVRGGSSRRECTLSAAGGRGRVAPAAPLKSLPRPLPPAAQSSTRHCPILGGWKPSPSGEAFRRLAVRSRG